MKLLSEADRKLILKGLLIGTAAAVFISALCYFVSISPTDSDGYRVFLRIPCGSCRRGIYAAFIPPESAVYAPSGVRFIKQIYCVPGDVIVRKGRWFYCNGKKIAYALEKTKKGQPLSPWGIRKIVIPEGYFFVKGKSRRSYDSRYYGLISKSRITGCYKPLF